jgi:hypothetical protein
MWGGIPTPHGLCSFSHDPYHHVRKCLLIRQIFNDVFGHMNTLFSRPGNDCYFGSCNLSWSQQSNPSWQAQDLGIHAPQFHGLQYQSYQQFYDHAYSSQSAPHQHYHEEPPLSEIYEKLKEIMSDFHSHCKIYNQQLQSTMAKTEVHFKQISEILKEEALQDQLLAILKGHYMEEECTFYYEQAITTLRGRRSG